MKHTLFSRTVQIACVKTHAISRTRPMRFYACVIFDAIIRNEKTQRILSESTFSRIINNRMTQMSRKMNYDHYSCTDLIIGELPYLLVVITFLREPLKTAK